MAVRSKRLFGPVEVTTGAILLYTVPAGETALLKHLEVGVGGVTGTSISFFIGTATNNHRCHLVNVTNGLWSSERDLFIVLQPGDELRALTSAGTVTASGFGAELEGVAD